MISDKIRKCNHLLIENVNIYIYMEKIYLHCPGGSAMLILKKVETFVGKPKVDKIEKNIFRDSGKDGKQWERPDIC